MKSAVARMSTPTGSPLHGRRPICWASIGTAAFGCQRSRRDCGRRARLGDCKATTERPHCRAFGRLVYLGWHQVAFADEIVGPVTPVEIGDRAFVLVLSDHGSLQAFDGVCPHRGAHLGYG